MQHYIVFLMVVIISGCTTNSVPNHPLYTASKNQLKITGQSFTAYQDQTIKWLRENRVFLTADIDKEIKYNAPFELQPHNKPLKMKGIILVHGLGDSPYYFSDIAEELSQRGFLVRTLLLPGHGSRPADLLHISADSWKVLLKNQIQILKADVDEVYLGGFSTGANLVTSAAMKDRDITGLVLFSPAFSAKSNLAPLSPLYALYEPWFWVRSPSRIKNITRYSPVPSNAFAQYYYTSRDVKHALTERTFDKPVFMVLSESDSVVDVDKVAHLFSTRFTHSRSRLIWFGNRAKFKDHRVLVWDPKVPEFNVSNYSHMGLLFKVDNAYYGYKSGFRICGNGQSDENYLKCIKGEEIWFSAWGYQDSTKPHARLTFNPKFENMMQIFDHVFLH